MGYNYMDLRFTVQYILDLGKTMAPSHPLTMSLQTQEFDNVG